MEGQNIGSALMLKDLMKSFLVFVYLGKNKFSKEQLEALKKFVKNLEEKYPASKILGHKDLGKTSKTCPNFDVISWSKKI